MGEKLVLIDGHSILNRAYYGMPDLTNAKGLHTNAVYGFLNILFKILEMEQPQYLIVTFDEHAPTFRHEKFAEYKGTRKPMQAELREQVPVMKSLLAAMGIYVVSMPRYEADDLMGTLSHQAEEAGLNVSIVSGDRDLLQLATEHISIIIPKTKKTGREIEVYGPEEVRALYHVSPTAFIDVKALMGDSSDNIPGVPGIGEKGAISLIETYGSIENAHAHAEEISAKRTRENLQTYYAQAVLSKELATIVKDAPVALDLEAARIKDFYTPEAYTIMKELEFKNYLSRFSEDSAGNNVLGGKTQTVEDFAKAQDLLSEKTNRVSLFIYQEGDTFYGIGFAKDQAACYFLPAGLWETKSDLQAWLIQAVQLASQVVCQDAKVLRHLLGRPFPEEVVIEDAHLIFYLLHPTKKTYTYDEMASEYAGVMLPAIEDLMTKKTPKEELPKKRETYTCAGAYGLFCAIEPMLMALNEQGMEALYREVELPLVETLAEMEKEGMLVDRVALQAYGDGLEKEILVLEKEIYALAGKEFTILSPKQLGIVLFEDLGLPNAKKTKTGYSTSADVLDKLAPDYPIVEKVLLYRQLTKLKSTYADGLQNEIKEDGRIHTTFHQTMTATGRLSSSDPNLQNIPIRMELGRQIRKVFVPREGFVFVDADYSQIELRVLTHMSGDEALIHAYRTAQDIHALTASQVFHVPIEEVTPLQRRNAKAVNFGIIYGISDFGLSEDLSISRKEAKQYMEQYFETYPSIKAFLDGLIAQAKTTGVARTMYGRIRQMPELKSSNFMQRSFGEGVAMNAPIQGTAADIIKIAMNRVAKRLKKENCRSRLILQVHDELLIEAAEEEADYMAQLLREEMEQAADLQVPLEVDVHSGANWYEAK